MPVEAQEPEGEDTELPDLFLVEGLDMAQVPGVGTKVKQLSEGGQEDVKHTAIYVQTAPQLNSGMFCDVVDFSQEFSVGAA